MKITNKIEIEDRKNIITFLLNILRFAVQYHSRINVSVTSSSCIVSSGFCFFQIPVSVLVTVCVKTNGTITQRPLEIKNMQNILIPMYLSLRKTVKTCSFLVLKFVAKIMRQCVERDEIFIREKISKTFQCLLKCDEYLSKE